MDGDQRVTVRVRGCAVAIAIIAARSGTGAKVGEQATSSTRYLELSRLFRVRTTGS